MVKGGARQFPALWHLAEGLFVFINYFSEKEGFLNRFTVK